MKKLYSKKLPKNTSFSVWTLEEHIALYICASQMLSDICDCPDHEEIVVPLRSAQKKLELGLESLIIRT